MISGLPQQGQPIDLQYISELAQSVVDLNSAVSAKSYSKSLIRNQAKILKNDITSNISIYASYEDLVNDKDINPGDVIPFSYNFSSSFSTSPVVTATPVNSLNSPAGKAVSIVIGEITPGSISGFAKFHNTTAGKATVGINIVAIGVQGSTSK